MPDVSIAISVRDNFSDAITTMRNANQSFNKDLTGTMDKLNELNKTKYQLKVDTDKAKDALKEAEQQYQRTGDAADKMARDMAASNYDSAKRNLNLVSQNARQAEKDIVSMTGAIEKSDNRASRVGTKETGTSGVSKIMHGLAGAGMTKMMGDSLSGVADAYISSAFNDKSENMVGGVLGGITSGAALGTMADPGIGTVVGAAVGGVTGAINGAVKNFQKEDDAFKAVAQDSYNTVKQEESDSLTSGISLATTKEGDLRSFSSLLGGNTKKAGEFRSALVDVSRDGSLSLDTITGLSKEMLGLGNSTEDAKKKINDLDETATALNWSDSTATSISAVMEQIQESGTASSKMLKTLEKNGIQAHDILAKAFKIKKGDIDKDLGKMDASSVVNALYNGMGSKFAGSMKSFQSSYDGLLKKANSLESAMNTAMGEGHNEAAKQGLQDEINTLGGKTGSALKEAYNSLGKFKANLENTQKQLMDNALTSVVTGKVTGTFDDTSPENDAKIRGRLKQIADDYQKQKALADKGNMEAEKKQAEDVEEAKVIAANAYKGSKGYQLELQEDLSLAGKIRDDTSLSKLYYDTGLKMGEEFSKGLASTVNAAIKQAADPAWSAEHTFGGGSIRALDPNARPIPGSERAIGLNRVPFNNYPAILHEDERVLTGVEARSQKSSGGVSVQITGPVTVRKESDIDEIASALFSKLQKARAVTP